MKIKTLLIPGIFVFIIPAKKVKRTPLHHRRIHYLTTSTGSTWNYHETDSSGTTPVNTDYTITSTARDTSINSKSYHVFTNSLEVISILISPETIITNMIPYPRLWHHGI